MVVDDFNLFGISSGPNEADAPLVIDADAVLTLTVAREGFEPVAGRKLQKIELHGGVEQLKSGQRPFLDVGRQPPGAGAFPKAGRFGAGEALDHTAKLAPTGLSVKRIVGVL